MSNVDGAGANLYTAQQAQAAEAQVWSAHEAARLRTMGMLVASVTEADLAPIFTEMTPTDGTRLRFIDIGAGSDTTTEELCDAAGVEYTALDGKEDFLEGRSTEPSRKILADVGDIPRPDGSYDVTFSRAVTAWQEHPRGSIAEQLRVTRLGGVAVFTEFDWTHSGAVAGSPGEAAIMTARSIMMLALSTAKFKPDFGAQLGKCIDEVVEGQAINAQRTEVRHDLPSGDYTALFLDAAQNVLLQLRATGRGQAAVLAGLLEDSLVKIEAAGSCLIRLPALVTQIVRPTLP